MACMSMRRPNQSVAQRQAQVKASLKTLEAKLKAGRVSVAISPQGAVAFDGWQNAEREDVTDACAFNTLQSEGSWELKQAVARAEAMSGRKVSAAAVAGGSHSHDGGRTWGPGHSH